jgi:hypothetical protein
MPLIEKIPKEEIRAMIAQCQAKGLYRVMACLLELLQLRAEKAAGREVRKNAE